MQTKQLHNIQRLDLWAAECPDFPPMPRLTHLTMSFEPVTAHAKLPLPSLTMLEVLTIWGADSWPSLGCLRRLTRLSVISRCFPYVPTLSADVLQSIQVCPACSTFLCTDAFA